MIIWHRESSDPLNTTRSIWCIFVAPKDSVYEHRRADVPTYWCNNTEKRVDYGNFSTDLNSHISFSDTHSIFIPLSNHTLSLTSARRNSITP